MSEYLIPPRLLFRLSIPIQKKEKIWTAKGANLGEEFRLPALEELDGRRSFADVRAAWAPEGLAFFVRVEGKRNPVRCMEHRLDESDGLQVWIDTRDTHSVHRASRFCHRFGFVPSGAGRKRDEPAGDQLLINRARENAKPIRPGVLQVRSEKRVDGYLLECFIPATTLSGYDPAEHPRLGFAYAVRDFELGQQTLTASDGLPFDEDPSLWYTLELV